MKSSNSDPLVAVTSEVLKRVSLGGALTFFFSNRYLVVPPGLSYRQCWC